MFLHCIVSAASEKDVELLDRQSVQQYIVLAFDQFQDLIVCKTAGPDDPGPDSIAWLPRANITNAVAEDPWLSPTMMYAITPHLLT